MKKSRSALLAILTLAAALVTMQCKEKKQLSTAKGNAVAYGKAHCLCEKLKKKKPPGDLTQCTDAMARATRYLKINYEFNSFSDEARQEIDKAGTDAFHKCMAEP